MWGIRNRGHKKQQCKHPNVTNFYRLKVKESDINRAQNLNGLIHGDF